MKIELACVDGCVKILPKSPKCNPLPYLENKTGGGFLLEESGFVQNRFFSGHSPKTPQSQLGAFRQFSRVHPNPSPNTHPSAPGRPCRRHAKSFGNGGMGVWGKGGKTFLKRFFLPSPSRRRHPPTFTQTNRGFPGCIGRSGRHAGRRRGRGGAGH